MITTTEIHAGTVGAADIKARTISGHSWVSMEFGEHRLVIHVANVQQAQDIADGFRNAFFPASELFSRPTPISNATDQELIDEVMERAKMHGRECQIIIGTSDAHLQVYTS